MSSYGAVSLFLAPEYLGKVSFFSIAFVGAAIGIFIMSWNVTTFILHTKLISFLATTAQPFLKYCINNALIPLGFLIFYLVKGIRYEHYEEYNSVGGIVILVLGFITGFTFSIGIAFVYFFSADRTIYRKMSGVIAIANKRYDKKILGKPLPKRRAEIEVDWFFSAMFQIRKPRDVRHYSQDFLNSIFKRHHLAAVFAIMLAFISLITISFFLDTPAFIIPAAASITLLLAILVAASGAFSSLLKRWSIPLLIVAVAGFNYLYQNEFFDPRNKVYGLNYHSKIPRSLYNAATIKALASDSNIQVDKQVFLQRLNHWKQQQGEEKPILFIMNVSGGGTRSATFTMNTLQRIDSVLQGSLMKKTFLINGASGGMLGAAYYRELYLQKLKDKTLNPNDKKYVDAISKDLLNPVFSSFVARDILGPAQQFEYEKMHYVKDRGYAFERQLNINTQGILDKKLKDYIDVESKGITPTILYNSVITRDGRKMIIGSQPVRFLMRPVADTNRFYDYEPDAIDFNSYFKNQGSANTRILSALRMNATFPYVLPNVWLPTEPVIDVMDAGLRDNYGQETSLRFIETFKDWLLQNTGGVVLIQIRDRAVTDWDNAAPESNSVLSFFTKPFMLLQNNLFNIQDYYQHDALEYSYKSYGSNFKRVCFQYIPGDEGLTAGLSFHLTTAEKNSIAASLDNAVNQTAMQDLLKALK